jgi:hypothetical protein
MTKALLLSFIATTTTTIIGRAFAGDVLTQKNKNYVYATLLAPLLLLLLLLQLAFVFVFASVFLFFLFSWILKTLGL